MNKSLRDPPKSTPLAQKGPTPLAELNDDEAHSPSPQNTTKNAVPKDLSLEEIIHIANRIGLEYCDRKREAESLELRRTTVRSQIMNRIEEENPGLSENKLRRLAEADAAYADFLESIATSRAEAEKLRIRYESYRNLFDAKRTLISYKKTELRTL